MSIGRIVAKNEGRAAQDDSDQDNRKGNKQGSRKCSKGGREDIKQTDDQKDQPDVISLPNGTESVIDKITLALGLFSHREEVPDTCAKVGTTKNGVEDESPPENNQSD